MVIKNLCNLKDLIANNRKNKKAVLEIKIKDSSLLDFRQLFSEGMSGRFTIF